MRSPTSCWMLIGLSVLTFSCGGDEPETASKADTAPADGAAPGSATDRPTPPVAAPQSPPADAPAPVAARPVFEAEAGWLAKPVTSPMRKAHFVLPKQGGDAEDAELVVFWFQGGGGGVDANVERWLAQIAQPDGGDSAKKAERKTETVGSSTITTIEVGGTYVAETRPGSGERVNKPGFRLLGAILEREGGPFYLKLTGPDATVAHWRSSFESFARKAAR